MDQISPSKFAFLVECQFIRFDDHGKCHWVMYQRSHYLTTEYRKRLVDMKGCIRCAKHMEISENMPYCPDCLAKTCQEETDWSKEERKEKYEKSKAEAALAKKIALIGSANNPKTWQEASEQDKAARDAKKKKKKEIRKTLTVKEMLHIESIKKTKSLLDIVKVNLVETARTNKTE